MQRRWNGGRGRGRWKTAGVNRKQLEMQNITRSTIGGLCQADFYRMEWEKKTINRTGGNVWLVSLALQTNGGSPGCIISDAVEHLKKRKEGNEFVSTKQLHVQWRNSCHNKMLNLRIYFFKWGLKQSAVPGGRRKKCGVNRPPYAL